jgi:formate C-acetyltransferase
MRSAQASRWYADAYAENLGESPALREARALKALWSHCDIGIWPEERVAGVLTAYEPLGFSYGSGTVINEEAQDALAAENNYTPEQRRELDALLAEADKRRYRAAEPSVHTEAEIKSINAVAATSTFFGCHMILDYETILQSGLDGYRAEIARQRARHPAGKNEFYDVMDTMLDAVIIYIERSALAAEGELRGVFGRIAHMPPETFHEAIQLVWTMHMLNGCDSFGRFDGYMLPFFQKDDPDNAYSLIVDLMLKIEQVGQIQNMCIGGVDENGGDNYSELTRLIIKATRELGYKGPNLCLFVTPSMPDYIWDEALSCVASGIGLPALYNNGIFVDTLVRAGYPLKEARGFSLAGCSQLMIPGQCNFMNDIGMFNAMKVGEIALYDGYDPRTREFAGIRTGESFDSFEALYGAVLEQLDYFIGLEVSMHDRDIRHRASREGYAMRTLFIRGCLENAGYIMDGGARYNNVELEVIGITNLADHLWAIKQLVFEERRVTYAEMKDALANNWEGRETLRGLCRNAPKFGNGHDGVDDLRADLTRHIYKKFNEAPGTLGGVFVPGEVIFTAHDWTGKATGATADGRMAGEVLADSAGASQGMDLNGPTALMRSVLKLPVKDYMLTSTVLNLRFLPSIMKTPQSAERVRKLFETFFKQGGMQLQINVCDSDELRAAREDPDGHGSLIVRVGGYSAYFVRLPAALQDEIITRTAHSA